MAFDIRKLENLNGSTGNMRVWSYTTTDAKATVKGANYFDQASALLQVGDRILIKSSDVNFDAAVSAISAGAVTIAAVGAFA